MNTHVRERESHARLFIEVTPALRRVLAEVAEAAIDALDQIDARPATSTRPNAASRASR
jgi:hypothetical protein